MAEFDFIQNIPHTAFLFPGQGSQKVGMGQALAAAYPAARQTFEEADALLGFALSRLCFEGPEETLTDTINVQPALLTVCVAILRALQSELGDRLAGRSAADSSSFVAGHSVGEYTALVATGSLTFADGLRMVRERGRLMKAAGERKPGRMAAVLGLEEEQVATLCAEATANGGVAQVANDNCPGQVVISGDRLGMEAAMAAMAAAGARKVVPLAITIASHSPLMQPATDALLTTLAATPIAPPVVPIIGNTSAKPLTQVDDIRAELAALLTGSVRWTDSMLALRSAGVTRFVEIGPGDVLTGLMRRIDRVADRQRVSEPEEIGAFGAHL